MPLPSQPIEIFIEGLSQHVDEKARPQGKLDRADNVAFDKAGQLNKRRGYRAISLLAGDIHDNPAPELFTVVAQFRDELVLLSDSLWSVVSPIGEVDATSVVLRGPLPRGGYRVRAVIGDGVGEEDLTP
jgi:hypothetical protein